MPSSDIADIYRNNRYPSSLRWGAETGDLGISIYDSASGERGVETVELGSQDAKFVLDLDTRERGYGLIRQGFRDFLLTPVGTTPPDKPRDENYKPAIGCSL
jgi:hypothetical protein